MTKRVLVRALLIVGLLAAFGVGQVLAGGPVCPPPACPPPCAPSMLCPPPISVCGMGPACCPPPVCAPRPVCGPPPCAPPPCAPHRCKENPFAQLCRGAVDLVVGAVTLPFKLVDCIIDHGCGPRCGPAPCGPMAMCPPPCPPPVCGPPVCGAPGYGMRRPMRFGNRHHRARRFLRPFAKKASQAEALIADSSDSVFGQYW